MLKARKYADAAAFTGFHEAFATRAAERTGSAVAFSVGRHSWKRPLSGSRLTPGGRKPENRGIRRIFLLFKIAMRQGRAFEPADMSPAASTAIVSETLARRLWPTVRRSAGACA